METKYDDIQEDIDGLLKILDVYSINNQITISVDKLSTSIVTLARLSYLKGRRSKKYE